MAGAGVAIAYASMGARSSCDRGAACLWSRHRAGVVWALIAWIASLSCPVVMALSVMGMGASDDLWWGGYWFLGAAAIFPMFACLGIADGPRGSDVLLVMVTLSFPLWGVLTYAFFPIGQSLFWCLFLAPRLGFGGAFRVGVASGVTSTAVMIAFSPFAPLAWHLAMTPILLLEVARKVASMPGPAHLCAVCSYDLRGLPAGGVCPECGAPSPEPLPEPPAQVEHPVRVCNLCGCDWHGVPDDAACPECGEPAEQVARA